MAVVQVGCPLCGCRAPHPDGRALPYPLTRAVAWLLDHYGDTGIGVTSMAEAAQVSVRQLQALCHTHLHTTPGQLIREVRLYQARLALLTAQPGRETVRDIAAGVGYLSPSRFGAHYSAFYGEAPSTTLRHALRLTPSDPPADPQQPVWARLEKE